MPTLMSLTDMESVILATFERYQRQDSTSFDLTISTGATVRVDVTERGDRFDCGVPGYNLDNTHLADLRTWVMANIRIGIGTGQLTDCVNVAGTGKVNVQYLQAVSFNFHVFLTNPCGAIG